MKKSNPDVRDIYRATDQPPEPVAAQHSFEMIEREIRRQRIFNLWVGLLTLALVVFLSSSIVKNYIFAPEKKTGGGQKTPYLSTYTLPANEQWALEYRQVVSQIESGEPPERKDLSAKWLKNTAYHIIMGEQARRQNDLVAAQYHLEKALETFPEMTGIQRDLGTVYLKQQAFTPAAQLLLQALEQHPSSAELLNNLGAAYTGLKEYERAEAFFRQALQLQPDLAGCYRNLALLYQKTARTDAAVVAFEKYFFLNPKDTPQLEKYVVYLTGAGRIRDAIGFLERLEGADPLAVRLLLAKSAARDNDSERAVRNLREAARFLTPRQMIAEMHDSAFEPIARTEPFETLTYQLELAAVSLSTNLVETVPSP